MAKVKKTDDLKIVEETVASFLTLLGVTSKADVSFDAENDSYLVDLQTEDEAGLLIGNKGETISAIQYLLSLMTKSKLKEWKRVVVNVADWRERQEERLIEIADSTASRAIEQNKPQYLYNLTSYQRRVIHLHLSKNKEVKTESTGEGRERYLIVEPK